jgi:thioredoxin-like negative regulator of GroEL
VAAQTLAARHYTTRFLRIKVTTAPFFVDRLKVRTLPCIIAFVHGIAVDRYAAPRLSADVAPGHSRRSFVYLTQVGGL